MKLKLQNSFRNRKVLYLVLGIVMVFIFTLSIAYAVLSTTLNITGSTEILASSWDIHLENVKVKSGSVEANVPEISGTSSVSFDVDLTTPGDYYQFTVDVVNDGSIDAMIDSVVKTPELTAEQAKYIKYEITYESGESINTKQTLKKETTTPIKVRIEYRKDLSASDLPTTTTELSLNFTLIYVQSDGSGSEIPNNGVSPVTVVSGDGTQVGNEVCIAEECFYVISSNENVVTMLAKYNLYVGNTYDDSNGALPLENPTGRQDEKAKGYVALGQLRIGVIPFAGTNQHGTTVSDYNGSIAEGYVNSYSMYLTSQGVTLMEARLITKDELVSLGCNDAESHCSKAPQWVYSTSYWTGTAYGNVAVWFVGTNSYFYGRDYAYVADFGVRPVIIISKNYL